MVCTTRYSIDSPKVFLSYFVCTIRYSIDRSNVFLSYVVCTIRDLIDSSNFFVYYFLQVRGLDLSVVLLQSTIAMMVLMILDAIPTLLLPFCAIAMVVVTVTVAAVVVEVVWGQVLVHFGHHVRLTRVEMQVMVSIVVCVSFYAIL